MTSADINNNVRRVRRTSIPERPNKSINLLAFLKQTIGKELSQLSFPVQFNEPLSMLQRSVECMEAKRFLDLAAETTDLELQAAYVAMFNASTFLRISDRLKKPFNPMLGETFELDLWDEPEQMRIITEQVTHHPPMSAIHVESKNGWVFESTIAAQSRFKLTAMAIDVTVGGAAIVTFENNNYSYCMGRPETMVKFLKGSNLYCNGTRRVYRFKKDDENSEVVPVFELTYGEKGMLKSSTKRTLSGKSPCGKYTISSKDYTQGSTLQKENSVICKHDRETIPGEKSRHKNNHGFADFQFESNQFDDKVCPTDSRFRPDQRLMEIGSYDNAEVLKKYLEDKQRKRRKDGQSVKPVWFTFTDKVRHQPEKSIPDTQLLPKWTYTNKYFPSKAKGFDTTCESRGNTLFAFSAAENFSDASLTKDSKSQMALNVANLDSTIETQSKKEIAEYLKNEREKLKT